MRIIQWIKRNLFKRKAKPLAAGTSIHPDWYKATQAELAQALKQPEITMQTRTLTESQLNERAFTVLRLLDGLTVNEVGQVLDRAASFARNTSQLDCGSSEYVRCEQGFAPALHQPDSAPR